MTEILFDLRGASAVATLNRPAALNSLTLGMIRGLAERLPDWAADPAVRVLVLRGAGERAFCAGGDVVALWRAALAGDPILTDAFFREEYRLDRDLARFPKPQVSLWDGVVMGGGVGLSIYGSHRVVTERTVFAMPETAIGFFCDVGASWFLPRLPGRLGLYLALTGARLGA
ncbi:MAG: enoyl-CoA hydratase/isomerase family protein, partial [Deltaproteobacteria bacterium]|nr:enoyl-CoA hydratase/isomerase family protein [Deltaproteobacteria bacterium]